ncbi:MAG: hypothetical protein WDO71_10580 [Bacteroidota bacterium]
MYGYPSYYYTLKMDNIIYDFIKEGGWNAGVIKKIINWQGLWDTS